MTTYKHLDKDDLENTLYIKERSDKGKRHKTKIHGGKHVAQYNLAGQLEEEYDSLQDAAENNKVGATYQGILACCNKTNRKHRNKIWRWANDSNDTLDDLI